MLKNVFLLYKILLTPTILMFTGQWKIYSYFQIQNYNLCGNKQFLTQLVIDYLWKY